MTTSYVRAGMLVAAAALFGFTPTTASAGLAGATVELARLSAKPVVHDGEYWIALSDVGRVTSCELTPAESKAYEAWPCRAGGLLEVDADALADYVGPDKAPRRKRSLSPGEAQGFNPQPDPPKTFSIDGIVISRRILTAADGGYIPLVDLAKAMGGKVRSRGSRTWIAIRRGANAPLELNARTSIPR